MVKLHSVCGSVPRTPDRVTSWLSGRLSSCQPGKPGQGQEAVPVGEQWTGQNVSPAEALGPVRQARERFPLPQGEALFTGDHNQDFCVSPALSGQPGQAIYQVDWSFINLPPTKGSKSKKSTLLNCWP